MADDVKYPVNAGFFNAINEDRAYSADDMNRPYRKLISNGVFATPKGTASDDLQVFTADNGMNIVISKGDAIIGDKWFENPSDLTITISQNSEVLPRIDSIIAQVDRTQAGRAGSIVYRQGSASSNPVHAEINTDEDIFELRIADIRISPSCVKVTQDLITDCRGSNECPWITSLIYQVDTSTLYAQWQAAYQKYYDDQEAEHDEYFAEFKSTMASFIAQEEQFFETWFNQMKNQLSEDAAGNLQLEIDNLKKNFAEQRYYLTLNEDLEDNSELTIPCNYQVGNNSLKVYFEGELLEKNVHYREVGEEGSISNKIKIENWGDVIDAGFSFSFEVTGTYEREVLEE